jgi:hypothetical protein
MGRKATVKSLEFPDMTVQVVGNTAIDAAVKKAVEGPRCWPAPAGQRPPRERAPPRRGPDHDVITSALLPFMPGPGGAAAGKDEHSKMGVALKQQACDARNGARRRLLEFRVDWRNRLAAVTPTSGTDTALRSRARRQLTRLCDLDDHTLHNIDLRRLLPRRKFFIPA